MNIKKELERLGSRNLNHIEVIAEVNGIEGKYKARELKKYPEAKLIRIVKGSNLKDLDYILERIDLIANEESSSIKNP